MEAHERDVVVIGAGVAGLSAAARLAAAGVDVVVLEARDRVGGRLLTEDVGGLELELGGQWIAPYQHAVRAVIADLGLELFHRFREGDDVEVGADRVARRVRHDAHDPAYDAAVERLARVVGELDPEAPWEHPRAAELDAVPYATWLREEIGDAGAREALGFVATGFMTKPAHSFSLLQAAWLLSSAGEVRNLLDADLVLDARVLGGAQRIAHGLAERLGRPRPPRRAGPRRRLDGRRRRRPRARRRDLRGAADRRVPPNLAADDPLRPAAARLADARRAGDLAGLADQGPDRVRRAVLARGRPQRHRLRAARAGLRDLRQLVAGRGPGRDRRLPRRRGRRGRHPPARAGPAPPRARLARPPPGPARAPADPLQRARLEPRRVDARRLLGDVRRRRALPLRRRPAPPDRPDPVRRDATSPASGRCTWTARSAPATGRRPSCSEPTV